MNTNTKPSSTFKMRDDETNALEIAAGIYIATGELVNVAERLEHKYRAIVTIENVTMSITALFKDGGRFVTKDNDNLYSFAQNDEPIIMKFNNDEVTYDLKTLKEAVCNHRVTNISNAIKKDRPGARVFSLTISTIPFDNIDTRETTEHKNILFDDLISKIADNERKITYQEWGVSGGFYNSNYKITYLM